MDNVEMNTGSDVSCAAFAAINSNIAEARNGQARSPVVDYIFCEELWFHNSTELFFLDYTLLFNIEILN